MTNFCIIESRMKRFFSRLGKLYILDVNIIAVLGWLPGEGGGPREAGSTAM